MDLFVFAVYINSSVMLFFLTIIHLKQRRNVGGRVPLGLGTLGSALQGWPSKNLSVLSEVGAGGCPCHVHIHPGGWNHPTTGLLAYRSDRPGSSGMLAPQRAASRGRLRASGPDGICQTRNKHMKKCGGSSKAKTNKMRLVLGVARDSKSEISR